MRQRARSPQSQWVIPIASLSIASFQNKHEGFLVAVVLSYCWLDHLVFCRNGWVQPPVLFVCRGPVSYTLVVLDLRCVYGHCYQCSEHGKTAFKASRLFDKVVRPFGWKKLPHFFDFSQLHNAVQRSTVQRLSHKYKPAKHSPNSFWCCHIKIVNSIFQEAAHLL